MSQFELFPDAVPHPQPDGPRRVGAISEEGAGRDVGFPARVEALLRSAPLIRLQSLLRHQPWAAGEVGDRLDVLTLALAALDEVMSRQGLEREATPADVVAVVASLLREQVPALTDRDARTAAGWLLDVLLNHEAAGQPFEYVVWDHTDHQPVSRLARFRLLEQREDPETGVFVLQATADAVNALGSGLQFDVEDAMAAGEFVLARQIERGAFAAAEATAAHALRLSQQYSTDIRRIITETRRDLRAVQADWGDGMAERLDRARDHLVERLRAERALLGSLADHVVSEDRTVAAASARIKQLLDQATSRHTRLHADVMTARSVFLAEQDRQGFRPAADGLRIDVPDDLLWPALRLLGGAATSVTDRFASTVAGPQLDRVRVAMLPRTIDMWWEEPTSPQQPDDDRAPGLVLTGPTAPVFSDEVINAARAVVAQVPLPARLSALLRRVQSDSGLSGQELDVCLTLVCLCVLWAFSPPPGDGDGWETLPAAVLGSDVVAVNDGTGLEFDGFDGDDLLVVTASPGGEGDGP